jgi:citrate synthase
MKLKDKIEAQLPEWRERVRKLVKDNGDVVVGDVTISQVYGGMRDVKSLVTDISYVDPEEGIRFRGYTIPEVLEKLPKPPGAKMPYIGGLYYLLLVGELPSEAEALEVEDEWKERGEVPDYVFSVLDAMPCDTHPIPLFSQAVLALQRESLFAKRYHEGMKKDEYWEPMLEDSLNLSAKMPAIAAYIYRVKCQQAEHIPGDPKLDWAGNFAVMMDIPSKEYQELSRLYFLLHSDHESGNVSAHTTHLVGSALSDIYYAFSAGLNGLAGPLHGLANQEALRWLLEIRNQYGGNPTRAQLEQYAWDTLNAGQVIPGYGHGVLRKTDPRFSTLLDFGKEYLAGDEIFELASMVYEIVPDVLRKQGKARDPWPNVDAISGVLQNHYGLREFDFYTLLFGVGRFLGVSANAVWARALGQPLERPKSLTTDMLEKIVQKVSSTKDQ